MLPTFEDLPGHGKALRTMCGLLLSLTAVFNGSTPAKSAPDRSNASPVAETKAEVIPVDGLICVACAARVKQTLHGIDGVTDINVDLEHRSVRVQYVAGKTSVEAVVAAINGLGYKAGKPVPADDVKSSASKV